MSSMLHDIASSKTCIKRIFSVLLNSTKRSKVLEFLGNLNGYERSRSDVVANASYVEAFQVLNSYLGDCKQPIIILVSFIKK